MPWSKTNVQGPQLNGSILTAEVARETVFDFVPPKFDMGTSKHAHQYIERKKIGSDFVMADAIREQTGVDDIENATQEEQVELKVLEKFKEVQERAYKEAYNLGLEEGRKLAFDDSKIVIKQQLDILELSLQNIAKMKEELFKHNEKSIIELVYHVGARLAKKQLAQDPEAIISVMKDALNLAQQDENVLVQLSTEQFKFVGELKISQNRELEFLKNVKFEENPEIQNGGCIVHTNYGEVDARIEQRVEQLWKTFGEMLPMAKDKLTA